MNLFAGILTAAPWHNSIGDIATAEATQHFLASAGVPATHVADTDEAELLVVGGGNLIVPGNLPGWGALLERFTVPGRHILNAVGFHQDVSEFGFLEDYRLIALRDDRLLDAVQQVRPDAYSAPCPAALIEPYDWEFVQSLPANRALSHLRPMEYVVVHRHPTIAPLSLGIDEEVLVVDAQVWRSLDWSGAGACLPASHSPRMVAAYVANAKAVVTKSLHLAIFALSAGVPFVYVSDGDHHHNEKVAAYLDRAGLDPRMTMVDIDDHFLKRYGQLDRRSHRLARAYAASSRHDLVDYVGSALLNEEQVAAASIKEREAASRHLDRVAVVCEEALLRQG